MYIIHTATLHECSLSLSLCTLAQRNKTLSLSFLFELNYLNM